MAESVMFRLESAGRAVALNARYDIRRGRFVVAACRKF